MSNNTYRGKKGAGKNSYKGKGKSETQEIPQEESTLAEKDQGGKKNEWFEITW